MLHEVTLDLRTNQPANAATPLENQVKRLALDLPPAAQSWAHMQGLLLWSDLRIPGSPGNETLLLISPAPGAIYRLATGFPGSVQQILLEAAFLSDSAVITFWIDDNQVSRIDAPPYRAWWTIIQGIHRVWAVAELPDGTTYTSDPITFEVK